MAKIKVTSSAPIYKNGDKIGTLDAGEVREVLASGPMDSYRITEGWVFPTNMEWMPNRE